MPPVRYRCATMLRASRRELAYSSSTTPDAAIECPRCWPAEISAALETGAGQRLETALGVSADVRCPAPTTRQERVHSRQMQHIRPPSNRPSTEGSNS